MYGLAKSCFDKHQPAAGRHKILATCHYFLSFLLESQPYRVYLELNEMQRRRRLIMIYRLACYVTSKNSHNFSLISWNILRKTFSVNAPLPFLCATPLSRSPSIFMISATVWHSNEAPNPTSSSDELTLMMGREEEEEGGVGHGGFEVWTGYGIYGPIFWCYVRAQKQSLVCHVQYFHIVNKLELLLMVVKKIFGPFRNDIVLVWILHF